MEIERKEVALELKEADDSGIVTGYGSVFGTEDLGGDVVAKGAFSESLKTKTPLMLWSHDLWAPPIGKWTEAKEDDHGLYLEGKLFLDAGDQVKMIHTGLKEGAITGLSIGFYSDVYETDKDTGIRTISKARLEEVSLVNFPMNTEARVASVKMYQMLRRGETPTKRDLEAMLRDAGFSRQQAKAFIAEGFRGIRARDADADDAHELVASMKRLAKTIIT